MKLHEVFNNQTLLEYDQAITLSKWGDRIRTAGEFNETYLDDLWLRRNISDDDDIAREILKKLESIDPTKNKQYVMTLVRWYTGVIKRDKELQGAYDRYFDSQPRERQYKMADSYLEYVPNGGLPDDVGEDGNYTDPENMNTFRLEDDAQIMYALTQFHRMKPQLPVNQRDINRFKSFYRFEDFVDGVTDSKYVPGDIDQNEILNREDVEVIYDGPLGTVTIPKSIEASCLLGKGTKWCTAGREADAYFNSYSSRGDLIIYNEKPGNAKYQLQVTMGGITIMDARDRNVSNQKRTEFIRKHSVLSPLIQQKKDEIFQNATQQNFPQGQDKIQMFGYEYEPENLVRQFIKFNEQHQGGVMKFVDQYYEQHLPSYLLKVRGGQPTAPSKNTIDLMLTYAQQRKKPWPEAQEGMLAITAGVAEKADLKSNVELKTINRLLQQTEALGSTPQLEKFKQNLMQKIAQANQPKQEETKPYTQQQITDESFLREFSESVDSEELVWHRDRRDRLVKVIDGKGWKFQLDNKLPVEINEGDEFYIPKNTYHRIHKGTSNLKVQIQEYGAMFQMDKLWSAPEGSQQHLLKKSKKKKKSKSKK
jgi:quercetin dioxygenase-like cupin family protein